MLWSKLRITTLLVNTNNRVTRGEEVACVEAVKIKAFHSFVLSLIIQTEIYGSELT